MVSQSKFKIVEKSRTIMTYPMTDSEIKMIGSLSLLEQILMNICSTFLGAVIGGIISFFSDPGNIFISSVLIVSAILFVICLCLLIVTFVIMKKHKEGITG